METTKLPEHYVFGLDIGTSCIVGTVGYKANDQEFIVAAQSVRYHETRAMLDGQIHDIGKVAQTIAEVKNELEQKLNIELSRVCIAAAGRVLKTVTVRADYEMPMEMTVTKEHVHSLELIGVEKAYEEIHRQTKDERFSFYCVAYTVVKYYLDDYIMGNLVDHKAEKISADVLATFLPDDVIEGLYSAVEKAGLIVENLTLEPIAAINVAIPEKFRLLNIALIDVGAGTSDISITKDGSIVAYGMIPMAGDAITETLVQKHLVEFKVAEQIKKGALSGEVITYEDIIGIPHEVTAEQVLEETKEVVDTMTRRIAESIKELNGGKSVSAVFIVGGGGKIPTFRDGIAKHLQLAVERVALRGAEVLGNVQFLEDITKDSLLVTPIGICLNYYEQKNSFISVQVNGKSVKLYDNNRLTVVDAAMGIGFPNEALFPRRGKTLNFTVNGAPRMRRGEAGEAAFIEVNNVPAAMNAPISSNDIIHIAESTAGEDAKMMISELPEYKGEIHFVVNGRDVICPKFMLANGELVPESYEIKENDVIETGAYYTLGQLLEFMDLHYEEGILINQLPAKKEDKVYENFSVTYPLYKQSFDRNEQNKESQQTIAKELVIEENIEERTEPSKDDSAKETEDKKTNNTITIKVTVNDETVTLSGKESYILVDILDVYSFDFSTVRGQRVIITCNGEDAEFTKPIDNGDYVKIYWEK
ncbi:MAG: cell division protein FtsA [Lachnospiraceae bacterium]|nr:cell division protein FtsA [Lachnospiraceae bacterium]